jgi:nickel-dependent lactate racemase
MRFEDCHRRLRSAYGSRFRGGSKLILPGISGYETINHHHTVGGTRMDPAPGQKPTQGMGIIENNRFKQNIDEAAEIAGIDFLINVTTNLAGDSVAIYCGEWKSAYAAALQDAQANYKTQKAIGFQVVVSNGYAKVSESMLSLSAAIPLVDTRGGDIVVIANAPEGQVTHYIAGIFGKTTYACHYTPCPIPDYVRHVFVLNEYPHPGGTCFKDDPRIIYFRRWEDVLARLQNEHPAPVRLAVIPDATMQYFNWYD